MNSLKTIMLVLILLNKISLFSQKNAIQISFTKNEFEKNKTVDLLREKYPFKILTKTFSLHISYNLFRNITNEKISLYTGLSYKKINLTVVDKIKQWNFLNDYYEDNKYDSAYHTFGDPADLITFSHNFGIINQFSFEFYKRKNIMQHVGIMNEIYLFEIYRSYYKSSDRYENYLHIHSLYSTSLHTNGGILYEGKYNYIKSANLSIFYKLNFTSKNNNSLGLKFSAGTNLYSNWDQFKKYAWLGLGLELGFGKKKEKIKASK